MTQNMTLAEIPQPQDLSQDTHPWTAYSLLHPLHIEASFSPFHWNLMQWFPIEIATTGERGNRMIFLRLITYVNRCKLENFRVTGLFCLKRWMQNNILSWLLFAFLFLINLLKGILGNFFILLSMQTAE